MKQIKRYSIYLSEEGHIYDDNLENCDYEEEKWCRSKDVDELVADHESAIETMQKRIDELEAERKQIKSAIDPGYDDIRYSMMLLSEILNEDK